MITARRINDWLEDVSYKDWSIEAHVDAGGIYLQVSFTAPDNVTGQVEDWKGRKWRLSQHMTKSEVIQTALKAVLTAEEHEARERFLYRGRMVFGPHIDVDRLWGPTGQDDALELRAAA